MIQRDYLIIGTGIGGASACEGVRKHDKRGSVYAFASELDAWWQTRRAQLEVEEPASSAGHVWRRHLGGGLARNSAGAGALARASSRA